MQSKIRRSNSLVGGLLKWILQKIREKRLVRYGLIGLNIVLLFGVTFFVLQSSGPSSSTASSLLGAPATSDKASDPLDNLSSADIAVNLARMTSLPEATAVTNQADSMSAELAVSPADNTVAPKPQAVATALKSRKDIKDYTAVAGDTVPALAAKFGVTSESIRWSNALTGDQLQLGLKMVIPPVNGIVYTVRAGDTPDTLAQKYNANKDQVIAYNDAEINGLKVGERIVIPNGQIATPVYIARSAYTSYGFSFGTSPVYGFNGYDRGWCTWYAASKVAVPNNWGNANTWDNLAPSSGWTVSGTPRVGAVGQTDRGGLGHVAYIEAVSDDGTMIKYSDMNGLAGFNRVGTTPDWVSAAKFEHYIYR